MNTKHSYWIHAVRNSAELGRVDRLNEVIFGLIMVLTFTCSISAATAGHEEIRTILWSALGCNIAWGFVDAFMYLFSLLLERGEMFGNLRGIQNATSETSRQKAIREALPPLLLHILKPEQIDQINDEIMKMPGPPEKVFLTRRDFGHALMIFAIVFISTFPVTLPFLFFRDPLFAIRVSNGVALLLLFLTGVFLARQTGRNRFFTGLTISLIGTVLVAVTMALGG